MTSNHWTADLARRCEADSFWDRLDAHERMAFAHAVELVEYGSGDRLFRVGEPAGWAAVLCGGLVRIMDTTGKRLVATRVVGDIIGEQALINRRRRSATVVAATPVRAAQLPAEKFDELIAATPSVLHVVCAVISERLREATLAITARTDAFTTVVRFLVRHAEQHPTANLTCVPVHIGSQGALATLLGVSRESVVRSLRRLRERDVVTTRHGVVVVQDICRLRTAPDREPPSS